MTYTYLISSILPLGLQNLDFLRPGPLQKRLLARPLVSEMPYRCDASSQAVREGPGEREDVPDRSSSSHRLPQGHGGHPQGHRAGLQPCEGEGGPLLLSLLPGLAFPVAPGTTSLPTASSPAPHNAREGSTVTPMDSPNPRRAVG